jgi:signal transduction histidine kinase
MPQNEHTPQADERPVILVIDDELGPRESLRFLLKDDYRVLCADSVDRGLKLLREQRPDTVIMDIRMPGRNGIDGLREIRSFDADIAVIMLTGFAAVGTAQEAIRLEASDYMEKPFDALELRRAVQHHVAQTGLRRKQRALLAEANSLDQRLLEFQEKDLLADLGQSSTEFVHDLRNALAATTGSLSLLRMEVADMQQRQTATPSEANRYLAMLEDATHRCVDLLDTWQRLIRQDPQHRTRFSLHGFVRSCVESSRLDMEHGPAIARHEPVGEDGELLGDHVQLSRVLFNLIQNAQHALPPDGGQILVRSETAGTSARISVSDNGCGISPENLSHIFSPHFTTRRASGGMGLGLFIAQKVAQSHGGTLTVESTVGQGTTFTLQLPLAPSSTAAARPER